jgi:hypothetical protein
MDAGFTPYLPGGVMSGDKRAGCAAPARSRRPPAPAFQVTDVGAARAKRRVLEDLLVQRDVRLDALHHDLVQCVAHARDRGVAVLAVRDDLGNQRIVVRRHVVASVKVTIHADTRAAGGVPEAHRARRRRELLRILRVDAAFDRVAADLHVVLRPWQALAGREPQLRLDQVDAGHDLRDRMLDLDARIHLDEVELAVLEQELERAGAAITDFRAGRGTTLAHRASLFL